VTRPGRPAELGRAIGAACRELSAAGEQEAAAKLERAGLDALAARNLIRYLAEQRAATGYVPDDRTLVVERFRDELGDWRVVLHSPYGDRVHAPWALAIAARLRERYGGMDVQALHTDDGIIIRVPDSDEPPPTGIALLDRTTWATLLPPRSAPARCSRPGSASAPAGRCCCRAQPGPAHAAVAAAAAVRAAARGGQPVPGIPDRAGDRPGGPAGRLRRARADRLLRDIAARKVRVVEVETQTPSPFGKSLLFRYVGRVHVRG
jgi:Lhr-like helicases